MISYKSLQDRPSGGLTDEKLPFAQSHSPVDNLEDVVKLIKPTAIIGKWVCEVVRIQQSAHRLYSSHLCSWLGISPPRQSMTRKVVPHFFSFHRKQSLTYIVGSKVVPIGWAVGPHMCLPTYSVCPLRSHHFCTWPEMKSQTSIVGQNSPSPLYLVFKVVYYL